jgi:hypothetical protein
MSDSPSAEPTPERFEVILEPAPAGAENERQARVSALDLDRLPDRRGVRLLVDAEQLERLRAEGLTVQVQRSVPVRPLDPSLIAADDDVAGWLSDRLGGQ